MKELEAIKDFVKSVERKFEELEKAIIGLLERKSQITMRALL